MTALLDTDVLVDCLRGTAAAGDWLRLHAPESFDVPGVVAMELVAGCNSQADLDRTLSFLQTFHIVWPEAAEFAKAFDLMLRHRLTTALSIPDCLIAAMALSRSARLYTFNLRHFQVVAGLDTQEPYTRA